MIKNAAYWTAFNAGMEHGKNETMKLVTLRFNKLKEIPGIGDKTLIKIEKYINGETAK